MDKKELDELVKTGEGYTIEFKESADKSLGKEICAFANASGGKIILGVTDKNKIKGFSLANKTMSQIQDIARNMDPSFYVAVEQIENIAIVYVPKGKDKPYSVGGKTYLRQGANSQRLNRDELIEFFRNCNKISFERQTNSDFNLKEDFDYDKFNSFIDKANISKTLPVNHILKNLNLLTDEKPNNACALLFPHRVTKFFLSADISCVLYSGNSKLSMLDKKEFNADFISNFENALTFILRNIRTSAEIVGVSRVETPEIPKKALREAILNAMIHRDYFVEGRILINIFANKVEIMNPGKLLFDEKELGNISVPRNPILADCMLRAGFVEKIGSGIKRIKELVPDVKFEISSNWFRVVFDRDNQIPVKDTVKNTVKDTVKDTVKLTQNQGKIIEEMRKNPNIIIVELAKLININERNIKNNILKLKEKRIIKRIGSDKCGHWEVLK